jgi:hypothetical protein
LALELRGGVRRSLHDWEGALDDMKRCGEKLRLYVKSTRPAYGDYPDGALEPLSVNQVRTLDVLDAPGRQDQKTGATARTFDLLTIEKIENGVAYVTEKNSVPLGDKAGWVDLDLLTWYYAIARDVVNASKMQATRVGSTTVGSLGNGRDRVTPQPIPGPPRPAI